MRTVSPVKSASGFRSRQQTHRDLRDQIGLEEEEVMNQVDVIASIEKKYRDELDLYTLLHCLCKEQQQAAKRGSTAEILRLAKEKEELMKKIRNLERDRVAGASLDPGSPQDESNSNGGPSERNRQAGSLRLRPANPQEPAILAVWRTRLRPEDPAHSFRRRWRPEQLHHAIAGIRIH